MSAKIRQHHLSGTLVSGLALGLFLARCIAEATRVPWSPVALVALIVASCTAFVWLLRWLDRRGVAVPLVPTLVFLIYVFWPQRDWGVALVVVTVSLLSALIEASYHAAPNASHFAWIDWLTFIVSFVVYLVTLQKDVLPADSGEFQLVVTRLGVLHQPGYPLYTLVGKLFTLLPVGTPALRLNLMSALLAVGTLMLVGATVRRLASHSCHSEPRGGEESRSHQAETLNEAKRDKTGAAWAGLAAVLALGTSTTFWAQATSANIRMPTVFFVAWCLYLLIAYRESLVAERPLRIADRHLILFALAFSLGFGHYFPLAVMGVFFVAYLVLVDPALIRQPRRWWKPLIVFALAQLVWLYLPIHAAIAPTKETVGLVSPGGFLWYATGQGFEGDFLAFAGSDHLPARLALLPALFSFQMNMPLLAAALVGAVLLLWRDWRAGLMLVGAFLAYTFIAITYRAPQTVEYEMPAYVVMAGMIGYGVGQISSFKSRVSKGAVRSRNLKFEIWNLKFVLAASVIVAGVANGVAHAPSFISLASDRSTREYVEPILRDAPQGVVVLADWHFATPMWYLQQIENVRPEIEVRYVYPIPGQEWSQVWRGLIEEDLGKGPVIVTHYWGLQYPTMPYSFEPFHQAWLVRTGPSFGVPPGLNPLSIEFDGKIRLIEYQISKSTSQVVVTLAWQAMGQLDRDYSFTVHVVDANGMRRTNRDRGYPTRTFVPGEVRVDRFTLPLEPTLAPGRYTVQVGVYFVPPEGGFRHLLTKEGDQMAKVASFDLAPSDEPLPTLHPLDVPIEGGPTLVGVDYDLSAPPSLRVYLHWRGPSPAGAIARMADVTVTLPELARDAMFVTGHDIPLTTPLRLSVARSVAGAWGWPISELRLPLFHSGDRFVLLSDQMVLIGVDSSRRAVAPGQLVDVTLRYLSLRPLVTNLKASVRMDGQDGAWRIASDDHPAGNAFPTLKWIAGSVVSDWRRLSVPADAKPGRAFGHLTIYDEVREDVLPPLDARMGDSVPLGEWDVQQR